MAREYSVIVGIDAGPARRGAREFRTSANSVASSSAKMSRGFRTAQHRATAMITTLGRLRGVATVVFSGFLGVGGITSVIRTLSQFETEISRVAALVSAQSPRSLGGAMAGLTEKARELGATTLFTATQAAEGMRFLTLAGFDALETYQAIEPTLNLAAAGMLDLGTAADITSNIMAAFSIEASETEDVVDALAFVSARTNTNIQQLGEAMKFVGPVAGTLGVNVEDTAVALGILGNSGLQASLAGTSLRRVMSGLLNPSKEAQAVFADLGVTQEQLVSTLTGPDGIVNLIELLAARGIDAADAFTLFGQRGAPGLLSLVNQREKLRDLTEAQREAGDVARQLARIMADNIGGDARVALSALQEAILDLGDSGLSDWLRGVTQGFTGFIRQLTGVKTPTDEMTDSMKKGAAFAITLQDNIALLERAMYTLVAIMVRNVIPNFIRFLALVGANTVTAITNFANALRAGSVAATLMAGAMRVLVGILASTVIGALLIGLGYLIEWAISSDTAASATEDFTDALERQRLETDKLVFSFDAVGEAGKRLAEVKLRETLEKDRAAAAELAEQIRELSSISEGAVVTRQLLTQAQEELNNAVKGTAEWEAAKAQVDGYQRALDEFNKISRENGVAELEAALEELNTRIANGEEDLAGMQAVLAGTVASLKAYREGAMEAKDATDDFVNSFKELTGLEQVDAEAFKELVADAIPAADAVAEVEKQMALFNKVAGLTDDQLAELRITKEQLEKVEKLLAHRMKEATEELNDQEKAAKKAAEAAQSIIDRLYPLNALTNTYYTEAQKIIESFNNQGKSAEELREALIKLREEYDGNRKELEENCEKAKESAECQTEAAKRIQQIWEQAMRNVQDAFADFFREGLDGFDDFADSLLNAFKDMIANMLAAWFASGLQNIFTGQAFGAGGNGFPFANAFASILGKDPVGVGAAGGAGGIGAGLASAGAALTGAAKAFFTGAKFFFQGTGSGTIASGAGATYGAGAVAAGAVTGLASGFVVDKILGGRGDQGTTNLLSGIGGAIGSIFGPLGALLGGALGSFASNLLGGAKALESATLSFSATSEGFAGELETITSKQKSFFRGRRFYTSVEDVDLSAFNEAFASVVSTLTTIGEQLGVDVTEALASFRFNRDIDVKGKSEEQIKALLEDAFNDAVIGAINVLVDNLDGVSDRLVKTVSMFKGNTDEFLRAFQAAATIELASVINPVTAAQEQLAAAAKSQMTNYNELVEAYRALLAEYDGSITSLETLAAATVVLKDAQMQLATSLIAAGEQISATFQNSAQSIREQLMSEEELYNYRRSQIDALIEQASMTTDPAQLAALAEQINSLGLDAWGMLSEEQQQALGEEFIGFFDQLDELFGTQISQGLTDLENDASAIDQEVANTMVDAAQSIIDSNNRAVDVWDRWERWFDNPPRWAVMNELSA